MTAHKQPPKTIDQIANDLKSNNVSDRLDAIKELTNSNLNGSNKLLFSALFDKEGQVQMAAHFVLKSKKPDLDFTKEFLLFLATNHSRANLESGNSTMGYMNTSTGFGDPAELPGLIFNVVSKSPSFMENLLKLATESDPTIKRYALLYLVPTIQNQTKDNANIKTTIEKIGSMSIGFVNCSAIAEESEFMSIARELLNKPRFPAIPNGGTFTRDYTYQPELLALFRLAISEPKDEITKTAQEAIVKLCESKDLTIRLAAARTLGAIPNLSTTELNTLHKLMLDSDETVRTNTAILVASLRRSESLAALEKYEKEHSGYIYDSEDVDKVQEAIKEIKSKFIPQKTK